MYITAVKSIITFGPVGLVAKATTERLKEFLKLRKKNFELKNLRHFIKEKEIQA